MRRNIRWGTLLILVSIRDMKEKIKKWNRNCPKCGEEIPYTTKRAKVKAEKRNANCKSCAMTGRIFSEEIRKRMSEFHKGQVPWNKGLTKETDIRVKKISESKKGEKRSEETKKRISESMLGDKNPAKRPEVRKKISEVRKGEKRSEETKKRISEVRKGKTYEELYGKEKAKETRKKQRLSAIKRIKNTNGQIMPNHNPESISRIEEESKKYNITDLQHAENGGEFQVCGYFVDGRSKEKNIVFEYYEPFHRNQVERDTRRKQEIIKELGCKFIEIRE